MNDLSHLERLCKGDRARMAEYIALHLAESPALFAQLEIALAAGDAQALELAAHTLRPQMGIMGGAAIFGTLTRIEELAREQGAVACAGLVDLAREQHEALLTRLRLWQAAFAQG
jgi:HPt (histidine-containing phosphotransfer) domain-containing protein